MFTSLLFIILYLMDSLKQWLMFYFSVCKSLIQQIIDRGNSTHMGAGGMDGIGEGHSVVEMSIPGMKVGLVIGKGGETIRQLQVICFYYNF